MVDVNGTGEWPGMQTLPTWRGLEYWNSRLPQYTANRPTQQVPPAFQVQTPGQMQYPTMPDNRRVQFSSPQIDPGIANAWQQQRPAQVAGGFNRPMPQFNRPMMGVGGNQSPQMAPFNSAVQGMAGNQSPQMAPFNSALQSMAGRQSPQMAPFNSAVQGMAGNQSPQSQMFDLQDRPTPNFEADMLRRATGAQSLNASDRYQNLLLNSGQSGSGWGAADVVNSPGGVLQAGSQYAMQSKPDVAVTPGSFSQAYNQYAMQGGQGNISQMSGAYGDVMRGSEDANNNAMSQQAMTQMMDQIQRRRMLEMQGGGAFGLAQQAGMNYGYMGG